MSMIDTNYVGAPGGELIAEGTPEEVVKVKKSETGKFLKEELR
jgi:excinuclease ABC subunit A